MMTCIFFMNVLSTFFLLLCDKFIQISNFVFFSNIVKFN